MNILRVPAIYAYVTDDPNFDYDSVTFDWELPCELVYPARFTWLGRAVNTIRQRFGQPPLALSA